jgi:hypothetical protein
MDVNIQEAWTHGPKKTKCETTHAVKCETQIYRIVRLSIIIENKCWRCGRERFNFDPHKGTLNLWHGQK